ncbi:hypothetical protein [Pseudomonas proteolytica]|uniref:hypothetical protein n=1 Tax=Pseudomonas proteolytica TaxID=219574 RepID=UPI0030EE61AA
MTEVKHTPGPFFTSCPHGGTIYVEARLRGSTIQEVAAVGPTETPEQQQANAKLFAAAPDLLALAEYMKSLIDEDCIEDMPYGMILAAIAKATQ